MTASHLSPGADDAPPPISEALRAHFAPLLRGTLLERCGMELLTLDARGGTATMPVEGNLQPAGLFHGGGHVVIAETLASMHAAVRTGAPVVGVDLNATHLRSITAGTVHARAQVLHGGRRLFNHEVRMTDVDGRLLSIVRISNMVLQQS